MITLAKNFILNLHFLQLCKECKSYEKLAYLKTKSFIFVIFHNFKYVRLKFPVYKNGCFQDFLPVGVS